MQPIILLICYARSGGTMLSRCLSSMENTFVASEVHPKYNVHLNLAQQSKKIGINLKSGDYLNQVIDLNKQLEEQGKRLVLRDWTFIDFTPHDINNFETSNRLLQYEMLVAELPLIPVVFVRDAIDIWISRWCPPAFFKVYKNYISEILDKNLSIFKYEDFCEHPEIEMKKLCQILDLPYEPKFLKSYNNQFVYGDMDASGNSRGLQQKKIERLKRKRIARPLIKWLNQQKEMREINKWMNYPESYESVSIEITPGFWKLDIQFLMKKIVGRAHKFKY